VRCLTLSTSLSGTCSKSACSLIALIHSHTWRVPSAMASGARPEPAHRISSPDVRRASAAREIDGPAISPICTRRTRCLSKESSRGKVCPLHP
jgi:hypothetical protein